MLNLTVNIPSAKTSFSSIANYIEFTVSYLKFRYLFSGNEESYLFVITKRMDLLHRFHSCNVPKE